ncbi:methionyl-tRNA formyltransferase [Helicobacter monodelphidis]|uniref:methionyl-tRNA formyltransferase n=1 Tax=Helicobacter sp. 15-1451 TaxID=2004995 RepID=UPI000DCED415|nr:methionyl-tRNA formyltransferase [Helicobacter sp. 15-1451]RAX56936.1 methionyl-tRNA formyltransferase [Helicobacter sp. 15-1451]
MRILFMGTPNYSSIILSYLLNSPFEVIAVVTQPDKPAKRGQHLSYPATKQFLLEQNYNTLFAEILQPQSLKNNIEFYSKIHALAPDVILVAAYGKILPLEILNLAPCYNLHASLLPKYRGASPIQESLLQGERTVGVSFMRMNEGLDCGDYLAQSVVELDNSINAEILFEKLAHVAGKLTLQCLDKLNYLCPLPQIEVDSSYCHKIRKQDGLVHFESATNILRQYRAYSSFPGIFLKNGLKLKEIELYAENGNYQAGRILDILKDGVVIGCIQGSLLLKQVQPPSKNPISALAYLNGKRLKNGDSLL